MPLVFIVPVFRMMVFILRIFIVKIFIRKVAGVVKPAPATSADDVDWRAALDLRFAGGGG